MISTHLDLNGTKAMFFKLNATARILTSFLLALGIPYQLTAAGPAPVDLLSTSTFLILAGTPGITTTGGGTIVGDVGLSPGPGAGIGVTCAQVTGTIYAVDATGPACAVNDPVFLTKVKGDLTIAYDDARLRTLSRIINPGAGNLGGLTLAPGLYKITTTTSITGSDLTLAGGPDDVWIFQCDVDLVVEAGVSRSVILTGGAQAKNVFWQVTSSATIGTFAHFQGNILALTSITMDTSSTMVGRALARNGSVTYNGAGAAVPAPNIAVAQPVGANIVSGGSKDFGSVAFGSSTNLIFTITNSGTADLTIVTNILFDGVDSALFTLTATPTNRVTPGSNTTFTVRFTPITNGLKTAALHITNNDSSKNPFNITLTGTGVAAPRIGVQQPVGTNLVSGGSNDFGSVALGSSTNLIFTITNSGTADLTIVTNILFDGADVALFTLTAAPTNTVKPGSNTTFTVRFAPLSVGLKTAALHITSNDTNNSPFNITLTGTGVAAPKIGVQQPVGTNIVSGGSKDFGSVALGNNTNLIFTITNSGTADLTGLGITITGTTDSSMFTVAASPTTPVIPGGSTTFTVRFTPSSIGVKTAVLHITSNDTNNSPFNITLTGTGVGAPIIAVHQPFGTSIANGGSKDFGSVDFGTNTSLIFTITNSGNVDLTITLPLTVTGPDAALFTVTAAPATPVSAGGSTTFTVGFAPLSKGPKTAVLHIASNDGSNSPFNITLTGSGGLPKIGVQQPLGTNIVAGGSQDFGIVALGTNTSLIFTITNSGTADLTGLGITIDGADAALFTVTASPTPPVLPTGTTNFTVRFAPGSVGLKTAVLHIANNDSSHNPFDITLTGTGTLFAVTPITLNRQTGLFEQTVRVTNSSPATYTAVRLLILALPADVQVRNASGTNGTTPYLQYNLPLAPGATVAFLIEYYRANRSTNFQPVFQVQATTPVSVSVTGTPFAINSDVMLPSGRFLIEFSAIPGHSYAVQYSSDLTTWKTAFPFITAPANRVQWYDDGPPKTESKPTTVGSRFYRVMQLP